MDIKYHFIRSIVNKDKVTLLYCITEEMVADIMTKPVTELKLKSLHVLCLVSEMSGTDPHLYCILVCVILFEFHPHEYKWGC